MHTYTYTYILVYIYTKAVGCDSCPVNTGKVGAVIHRLGEALDRLLIYHT